MLNWQGPWSNHRDIGFYIGLPAHKLYWIECSPWQFHGDNHRDICHDLCHDNDYFHDFHDILQVHSPIQLRQELNMIISITGRCPACSMSRSTSQSPLLATPEKPRHQSHLHPSFNVPSIIPILTCHYFVAITMLTVCCRGRFSGSRASATSHLAAMPATQVINRLAKLRRCNIWVYKLQV